MAVGGKGSLAEFQRAAATRVTMDIYPEDDADPSGRLVVVRSKGTAVTVNHRRQPVTPEAPSIAGRGL